MLALHQKSYLRRLPSNTLLSIRHLQSFRARMPFHCPLPMRSVHSRALRVDVEVVVTSSRCQTSLYRCDDVASHCKDLMNAVPSLVLAQPPHSPLRHTLLSTPHSTTVGWEGRLLVTLSQPTSRRRRSSSSSFVVVIVRRRSFVHSFVANRRPTNNRRPETAL